MRLSNRCWRAIAWRMGESLPEVMVWAKVMAWAKGKRHAFVHIALDVYESFAVWSLLEHPTDAYMRFVVAHERATNPEMSA